LPTLPTFPQDGFALFDCDRSSGGIYSPPFVNLSLWGYDGVKAQNGYLSLAWLSNNYHRFGMPTHNINVNGTDTTAITTKRTKVQEIEFAAFDFDPMELIKTDIGTGQNIRARAGNNGHGRNRNEKGSD
jgi:hypothetical protein